MVKVIKYDIEVNAIVEIDNKEMGFLMQILRDTIGISDKTKCIKCVKVESDDGRSIQVQVQLDKKSQLHNDKIMQDILDNNAKFNSR